METIVQYLNREQRTFAESPFNAIDSLVLSSLSYLNFDEAQPRFSDIHDSLVPHGNRAVLLHDILTLADRAALIRNCWLEDTDETFSFLNAVTASRRYRDVRVMHHVSEQSASVEKQFSATTFALQYWGGPQTSASPAAAYLAFRGTDGSLAGWKEDFNLAFREVIPSQRSAEAYVSGVVSALDPQVAVMVGGHSKGGNLAEYAALCVDDATFRRIKAVYNHDGPAFPTVPSDRADGLAFQSILDKTVPDSSLFGMLFENRDEFRVVRSSATAVFQHMPLSWLVDGDDFALQADLNPTAASLDGAINEWISSLPGEEREKLVDSLYGIIASTNVSTWAELLSEFPRHARSILDAGTALDDDTRRFLLAMVARFAVVFPNAAKSRIEQAKRSGMDHGWAKETPS